MLVLQTLDGGDFSSVFTLFIATGDLLEVVAKENGLCRVYIELTTDMPFALMLGLHRNKTTDMPFALMLGLHRVNYGYALRSDAGFTSS